MNWYTFFDVLAWFILSLGLGMVFVGIFHDGWLLYSSGFLIALAPFAYLIARL